MSREAMKQALDALGYVMSLGAQVQIAKDVLTEAIEQAEKQEPVAWASGLDFDDDDQEIIPAKDKGKLGTSNCDIPLYTAPKHDYVIDCPRCGHCCQALEEKQEPFEYWSVAGGWVKLDEMREHFEIAGCGTIYKSAGEGRTPLYPAPLKKEWVGLTDEQVEDEWELITGHSIFGGDRSEGRAMYISPDEVIEFSKAIEAKLKDKNT